MRIPGLNLSARDEGIPWRPTRSEGVSWVLVASEAEETEHPQGAPKSAMGATVLIRMEPGCGYPAHRHLDVEEVWVLAGGYRDEQGSYRQGEFVRYPAGSEHTPVALGKRGESISEQNPVCLLLATARGGIENLSDEGKRA